jgi:hypothetical protein
MGGFYNSVHIKTTKVVLVHKVLEDLAAEEGGKFLMAPEINGWVSVFPSETRMKLGLGAALAGELAAPKYSYDSQGRLKLASKDDMKSRGIASPDAADALALTFAFPVECGSDPNHASGLAQAWEDLEKSFENVGEVGLLPGCYTG